MPTPHHTLPLTTHVTPPTSHRTIRAPTSYHTLPPRYALPACHTRPLHTHLTTPDLLPSILYLYICTSHPPPAARSHSVLSTSQPSFCTAFHPSSAHSHSVLSTSQPSFCTPSHPSSAHLPALFREKICTPPPKASSNPPVEIFYFKRRRTLILKILPRRLHVDNSVSSHVYSE